LLVLCWSARNEQQVVEELVPIPVVRNERIVCGSVYIDNARKSRSRKMIIILTLGWVGYGERRHAELPREDVPSRL